MIRNGCIDADSRPRPPHRFLTADNLINVSRQSVYLMIVSLAQLVVLIGGGLDLSVGTIVALASVVGATVMAGAHAAWPDSPALAIAVGSGVGLGMGVVIGLVNGFGTAVLRIPAFMMPLGMSSVTFGLTLLVSGGAPVYGLPRPSAKCSASVASPDCRCRR